MRIQTRLFFGTTALVLSLMAVQWWVHARQVQAMQREFGTVATSVSRHFLTGGLGISDRGEDEGEAGHEVAEIHRRVDRHWIFTDTEDESNATSEQEDHTMRVMVMGPDGTREVHEVETTWTGLLRDGSPARVERFEAFELPTPAAMTWASSEEAVLVASAAEMKGVEAEVEVENQIDCGPVDTIRRIELRVVQPDEGPDRVLVVSGDPELDTEIPIRVRPTVERFQATFGKGFSVSLGLLAVGMVASAVMANRLSRPLRDLAHGAEAVGMGEFGTEVPITAVGEVGELQRSFNSMSAQLADLERQRDAWRKREHLAELGDLARGLAHTVRNPLNTLGLAVEELAEGGEDREVLVKTSRQQIRRIDRWLKSFLAVGAGVAVERESTDICNLVQGVVLEAVQQGARIDVSVPKDALHTLVVPDAVRAAVGNLVENAVDASSDNSAVTVEVEKDDGALTVRVSDSGPGLTEDVKARLFSPHVTTKAGGSGMGLFLTRQLIVGMHEGSLEVEDRDGGGTVALIRLPLESREAAGHDGTDR